MSAKRRDGGNRQKRTRGGRPKELGNYYIVTDARETEKNYFEGLRASFPANLQDKIEIKVCDVSSYKDLIPEALKGRQKAQFRQLWLVFDRDQIPNFDEILDKAQAEKIEVGWSNPCFELWLAAYFSGKVPNYSDSKECVEAFKVLYKRATKREYSKNEKNLYDTLTKHGDEAKALTAARVQYENERRVKPCASESFCTAVHRLVQELVQARNADVQS